MERAEHTSSFAYELVKCFNNDGSGGGGGGDDDDNDKLRTGCQRKVYLLGRRELLRRRIRKTDK